MAYERVAGPLGPARDDFHAAMICAALTNLLSASKRGKRAEVSDFLPVWDERERRPVQSLEEQIAIIRALNKQMGGEDLRGDDR